MLQDPNFVRYMAKRGLSTPTYAYANNNPIRYTDPTGLYLGPLVPWWAPVLGPFGFGFGIGFGLSQLSQIPGAAEVPTAGRGGMKGGRPRIPGTTCSSQPLDEQQQECKQQANNAATRAIIQGNRDEADLIRALAYCQCMDALDSATCTEELSRIGWAGYL